MTGYSLLKSIFCVQPKKKSDRLQAINNFCVFNIFLLEYSIHITYHYGLRLATNDHEVDSTTISDRMRLLSLQTWGNPTDSEELTQ
jgi:hypothetical protein